MGRGFESLSAHHFRTRGGFCQGNDCQGNGLQAIPLTNTPLTISTGLANFEEAGRRESSTEIGFHLRNRFPAHVNVRQFRDPEARLFREQ